MKHQWKVILFVTDEPVKREGPLSEQEIRAQFDKMDLDAGVTVKLLSVQKLN